MPRTVTPPKRYIVLDTCIVQHFAQDNLAEQMIQSLISAENLGYGFAISEFVFFESLDGISLKNEQERMQALTGLKTFYCRKKVLVAAAHLGCLYKAENISPQQISVGDKILGATAVMTGSLIYTTNGRDFPLPFFKPVEMNTLTYTKNNGQVSSIIEYYMEPQVETIVARHNERLVP